MLKLKLQYFGHLMQRTDLLEKTPMLGKIKGKRRGGRQRMRWLDSMLESRDVTLPTKVRLVKAMVFAVVMHGSEKAMAPYSSTLAWKIPWTEEPGRLQTMGSHRVGHN